MNQVTIISIGGIWIIEIRANADPKLFEAVISDGSKQGPVKFREGTAVKALINSER